jgi:hypothetical protein
VSGVFKESLYDNPFANKAPAETQKPAYLVKQEDSSSAEVSPNTSPVEETKITQGTNKQF